MGTLEQHVLGKEITSYTSWVRHSYLVDLVHHSEGTAVELLQRHEVEHGGDAALSSALVVRRQLVQVSVAMKLHPDSDSVLVVILLEERQRSVKAGQSLLEPFGNESPKQHLPRSPSADRLHQHNS